MEAALVAISVGGDDGLGPGGSDRAGEKPPSWTRNSF